MLFHISLTLATLILMTKLSSIQKKKLTSHTDYFFPSLITKNKKKERKERREG